MRTLSQLPAHFAEVVAREIAGEEIRWFGRPSARLAFLMSTPAWLMGIPWTVLCLGWTAVPVSVLLYADRANDPLQGWGSWAMAGMTLWGLMFVAVGLYMIAVPFLAWAKARRTIHLVTNRRILTLEAGRTIVVRSVWPKDIISLDRRERRSGLGTLTVVTGYTTDSDGDRVAETEVLFAVPDVRTAERHVMDLRARAA